MSENHQRMVHDSKWHHPSEVMKLMRKRKKALQARITNEVITPIIPSKFHEVLSGCKRKNPFIKNSDSKKSKIDSNVILEESSDQTVFQLLNQSFPLKESGTSNFSQVITSNQDLPKLEDVVKCQGEKWLPIDWCLKTKIRFLSLKPFPWNQKLKISEEASAITAFTRCLDNNTGSSLDISPNAKFYQCCLYWQQPCLPWLSLFPRNAPKAQMCSTGISTNVDIKACLQQAWSDSLRSLFQLIRTGQCPYFYACANSFTVLFRAAGICGFSDVHAIITPTTRGFRKLLNQEEIEYTMPLKKRRESEQDNESFDSNEEEMNEQDPTDDNWLKTLGVNDDDIKQFSYTQDRIQHRVECQVDNSEQSTILVEGVEVNALYNFLINCKSATSLTGPFADIPPTLLSPVAFQGASLNSLKIRENRVHTDDAAYHSFELSGPILPSILHNLFEICPPEHNMTITFNTLKNTESLSKLISRDRKSDVINMGAVVFRKENLSDCGLLPKVLKHFCIPDSGHMANVECLKYQSDNQTFTWT